MELPALVEEQNPWWRGPMLGPRFERDVVPLLLGRMERLHAGQTLRRAVVLSGLRRVGKTEALRQVANHLAQREGGARSVLYFDLSDPRAAGCTVESLLGQTGFLASHPGARWLLLDEVARDPRWTDAIKRLVDLGAEAPGIIVADSAAARLSAGTSTESAVGRRVDITLEPLSFAEVARFRGRAYRLLEDADPLVLGELADRYLLLGGLPEVAFHASPGALGEPLARIREDCERVVMQDVPRIREVRDMESLRRVWSMVAGSGAASINVKRTSQELEVGRPTVDNALGLLRDCRLVRELPSSDGARKSTKHPPKYVVADSGIAAAHLTAAELARDETLGRLMEVAILRHLDGWCAENRGAVSYARVKAAMDAEMDFLVEAGDLGRVAIEVKHSTLRPNAQLLAKLGALGKELGAVRVILVSRHPAAFAAPGRAGQLPVLHVPLWRFMHDVDAELRGER